MLEIILFLYGIGKQLAVEWDVLKGLTEPTDASSSQHTPQEPCSFPLDMHFPFSKRMYQVASTVPRGGVTPWEETRRVLETAEMFWLSTDRADGRPHVTPCVPVWHDGAIHFTATDTAQKTVKLRGNPHVILTTGIFTSTMKTNNEFSPIRTSCSPSNPPRSSPSP
jgi:hypothetical protein